MPYKSVNIYKLSCMNPQTSWSIKRNSKYKDFYFNWAEQNTQVVYIVVANRRQHVSDRQHRKCSRVDRTGGRIMVAENIQRSSHISQSYQCRAFFVQLSYFDLTGGRGWHIIAEIGSKRPRPHGSATIMKDREHREHQQKWPTQCDLSRQLRATLLFC